MFDLHGIADRANFASPDAAPEGIQYVIINGQLALADGRVVSTRAGRAVRCCKPMYDYQI